ncbi:MAG: acyltransferase, partial [Bacteroidales bacterium]
LFVMMSGVLIMPTTLGMSEFYKKRLGRIVLPLVFWSIILPLLFALYLNIVGYSSSPLIGEDNFNIGTTIRKIYTFIFSFNYDTTPLWYIYMLLGLYLVIPIINPWLKQASKREIQLFLGIWLFTLFIPYIKMAAPFLGYIGNFGNMEIFGVCDWNSYGTFYYVSGFIGYLVLAYYLVKYPLEWSLKKTLAYAIPVFMIGYFITFFGFVNIQKYFPGNYAYLEICWYFTGINVFMMTLPVFVLMQKINFTPKVWLRKLASLTFGIYLCHFVFVQISYDILDNISYLPVMVRIIGMAVLAFAVSGALVWIMKRWRVSKIFVD